LEGSRFSASNNSCVSTSYFAEWKSFGHHQTDWTPGPGVAVDVAPKQRKEPEEPFDPGTPLPFESKKITVQKWFCI
jgi:hypothetical protein